MKTISLKVDKSTLTQIENLSKRFYYSTQTEFIREAIRDKIKQLEMENFTRELSSFKGKSKSNINDKELRKIREKLSAKWK